MRIPGFFRHSSFVIRHSSFVIRHSSFPSMFLNSIRWRLQIWYGLILVAVLAGFGLTAYQLERNRRFRDLDDELQKRVNIVSGALGFGLGPRSGQRDLPGRPLRPGEFFPDGPRGSERPERPNRGFEPPDDNRPRAEDHPPRDPASGPRPGDFHLGPRQAALFDETDTNGFYYVLWRPDGAMIARSSNAPPALLTPPPRSPQERPFPVTRAPFREIFHFTPPGETIVAGRNISREMAELHRTGWTLAGVGGGVLLLGLAGGWWLASRAIRPIKDISSTAAKISAGDLSQRIMSSDTENELGQLALVLNSTFARLEAAFAQQKQFASDAAHELRTPIAVMLTQTQSTLNRDRTPEEYRQTLEACQRAAQRMRRLIESLLELARLDAGQETMKRLPFDLSETAKDCVEAIRPLAEERQIKVECELPPVECFGDPDRLAQVVTNLLTNAVNYNQSTGFVRIEARTHNGSAFLTVSDTGQGIPADELPHLFKRFYRADKARTDGRSGLGLAISKAIVEAHGGTIEVISELGKGTSFTVRLSAA
jgi:signal transduction histidine kinase